MRYLITLMLLLLTSLIFAGNISLNTADTAPYSTVENEGFYDILLTEIFQSLNYDLNINHYPSERSILWANEGHDDGEFARISGLSLEYKNLIEIKESLVSFYFVALKKENASFSPTSWEELKDLRVGYLRGWKIYERNVGEGSRISVESNIKDLFNLLLADRLDIILYSKLRALEYISENNIEGIEIIEKPLSERTMHLYMHSQHANLVPLITDELISYKASGRYSEIYNEYLLK